MLICSLTRDTQGRFISRGWRRNRPGSGVDAWSPKSLAARGPLNTSPEHIRAMPRASPSPSLEWNPRGFTQPEKTVSPFKDPPLRSEGTPCPRRAGLLLSMVLAHPAGPRDTEATQTQTHPPLPPLGASGLEQGLLGGYITAEKMKRTV